MSRERKGSIVERDGRLYARLQFIGSDGKKRDRWRRANSRTQAREIIKRLFREIADNGEAHIDAARMTMNDLCDYYTKHYLMPAEYVNGRKVAGLRSFTSARGYVKVFREHFGRKKLQAITYDDVRSFRIKRLKSPTHQSGQRSIGTVHRELSYLRRLLNIAERNGWIRKNPFKTGDALINMADETKRERIITREEEARLLAACTGYRAHLRPIIIAALDTGCRLGELLKMRWRDVDTQDGIITIQAFNTKTMRERQVSITSRLALELERLRERSAEDRNPLVFGVKTVIRQAFDKACKEAELQGLRMHDLRHTHATRLDDLGFSLAKIGGQLGHTVLQTTLRYVNRDKSAVKQVAVALDAFNSQPIEAQQTDSDREYVN